MKYRQHDIMKQCRQIEIHNKTAIAELHAKYNQTIVCHVSVILNTMYIVEHNFANLII